MGIGSKRPLATTRRFVAERVSSIDWKVYVNAQPPSEIWATLAGVVDLQMTQRIFAFFADALRTGVKTVHLLMHSSGGFVTDGVGLYNYVANLPIEVITYNAGGVSSIAVIVFLAGKKRVADETATFMIHKRDSGRA